MAQKEKQKQQQRSPLDEPPTASSSSSEEEDPNPENEEEEEASSEEDLPPVPPTNSHLQSPPSKSKADSGSGSETESEPNLTPAKVKAQPLASKSASKRPAENAGSTDPKRRKRKPSNPSSSAANKEDGNKSHYKLWSEQDELAILKGALDFTSKTGQDPLKSMHANAFLDFIKKSLHVEVSPSQLKDKLKKLKTKFRTNATKGENGEGPSNLKPHDRKVFQLSKKVWGSEIGGGVNGSAAQNTKKKETQTQAQTQAQSHAQAQTQAQSLAQAQTQPRSSNVASEKMQFVPKADSGSESLLLSCYKGAVNMNENDLKRAVELIDESKRAELEERWKKLQLAEMELLANHSKLIADQTRLILEVLKDE